ncbi:hypothetical protein ACWF94_34135 [Streptomyces sp. NPDC055078]
MAEHQLPVETGVFARYLKGLTELLDRDSGWYAVFRQRDPEGMRECLEGVEVPPWDVVDALLKDLAVIRGPGFAHREGSRAHRLHGASAAAFDRQPGGREALEERLGLMRHEVVEQTARAAELAQRLAAQPAGSAKARSLASELEWTRDDQARAVARLAELRSRLAALTAGTSGTSGASVGGLASAPGSASGSASASGRITGRAPGPAPATAPGHGAGPARGPGHRAGSAPGPAPAPRGTDTSPAEAYAADAYASDAYAADTYAARQADASGRAQASGRAPSPRRAPVGEHGREPDTGQGVSAPTRPLSWFQRAGEENRPAGARERQHPAARPPERTPPAPVHGNAQQHRNAQAHRGDPAHLGDPAHRGDQAPPAEPGSPPAPDPETPAPADRGRRLWRGRPKGARYAGAEAGGEIGGPGDTTEVPPQRAPGDAPRGARYGALPPQPSEAPTAPGTAGPDAPHSTDADADADADGDAENAEAVRTVREIATNLGRLRAGDRGGEAYVLLCEAAALPADVLPFLADELRRAGLDADWATLLWEAASGPLPTVAAIAWALSEHGRDQDAAQLLRQGVTRPAGEIADAVLLLADEGRDPEAYDLLTTCVQLHSPEDAARIAEPDPPRLVPLLLEAARAQSPSHERHLVHALRVAGHLGR